MGYHLNRTIAVEGDAPLTVGIEGGLGLQIVAAAACGIKITAFGLVEEGPSASASTQSELKHIGFARGVSARRNGDGIAIFAHNHSMTVVRLLVTHSEDA